jgi:tetratricopeptide (TPR) repeat protein
MNDPHLKERRMQLTGLQYTGRLLAFTLLCLTPACVTLKLQAAGLSSPNAGAAASAPETAAAPTGSAAAREAARLNNLGTAFMNQQLLERAAENFAKAYDADPSLALAKINQGLALIYLQRFAEAQQALEVAAAKAPADPHTWYALGLLYRNQSQPKQALEAFNKVLALDPTDADTHYLAASIDLELNDLPAALAEYHKALAINPLHASAQFGLARALQRQGQTAAAHDAFAQFQHITNAHLGAPLAHTYGDEGRYARVEDAALAVTAVGPMIPVSFVESARTAPLAATQKSTGGACLMDMPDSGLTLVVASAGEHAVRLFRTGNGRLEDIAETGIGARGTGLACAVGDFDNDGLPDLALAVQPPSGAPTILLYRNLGNGRFEDVTPASGITPTNRPSSLTWVDFDHDGDLDLLIPGAPTATLWRNNGNRTFTDWTKESGLAGSSPSSAAMLSDLNNDRAVDLIVTGQGGAPTFFANRREGPFAATPLYTAPLAATTSVATLDFNKDGWMDVLLTHDGAPGVTLWRNHEGISFERVALPLPADTRGATAAIPIDFDNDGWIDLALLLETRSGPQLRILRNLGPAGFRDVSEQLQLNRIRLDEPRSLIAADLSRSGATDLLVTQADGSVVLVQNRGGNQNHSLLVALKGVADNKSGIGTKVEVFANGLWQKWEATGQPELLAGLGTADRADLVRLLWPTGVPQDEIDLKAEPVPAGESKLAANAAPHVITELDRRGSSCPTLFAWDGGKYSFIADVIGAGVVGHWISPTQHNIPDPDEWIKIDGGKLRVHDGSYSLRFGEPMEEVNFVDQVRLVAVDHPANAAVYPNEGFLSTPPFAQAKTIVAASARPLAGAWDDHGANVLPILNQRPSGSGSGAAPTYVRDFTNLPFAGFANQHTLTLDLGAWSTDKPLRLLLHGFIEYFSASSMYSAWQAGLSPIPPYVEAQLPDGSWRKVIDDMGFPAGLPRTVVVDLTGKLPVGARRIRITTNLQIYWDRAEVDNEGSPATAASAPSTKVRQTELPLSRATLAFRGYPQQLDGRTPGDLTYNYQQISATGPFVPHWGSYTRYGDVTPLLHDVDDAYVIFGTGEDMDLEFAASALPPLPQGWSRDLFFYANGFVKDMDFYEASPFAVGQLPFHGMSTYPYPATEHYPDDPAHTAYQLEYNTRFETGSPHRDFQFHYVPSASVPDSGH